MKLCGRGRNGGHRRVRIAAVIRAADRCKRQTSIGRASGADGDGRLRDVCKRMKNG